MKTSLPQVLLGLCCCAISQLAGCMPLAGTIPNGYPGQPNGVYPYQPYPVGPPWHPVGYPPFPGGPGIPIVLNPTPLPGPTPTPPDTPTPNPGTTPTIPIGNPGQTPTEPNDDSTTFWSPWPLPPRGNQRAARNVRFAGASAEEIENRRDSRGFRSGDQTERVTGTRFPGNTHQDSQRFVSESSGGDGPTPHYELRYRGGRIIRDLSYVNLYVSGDTEWSEADVTRIDRSLSAAMRDEHLNNVLLQYFNNQPISANALPSHPLVGYTPDTVTRGDIQNYVTYLHQQGFLRTYDLKNTVFNFLLPPGTVLTTDNVAANSLRDDIRSSVEASSSESPNSAPASDDVDSLAGLGGYHGSVVIAGGGRIYFSVDVYSERHADGSSNGIPVFEEPWKNIVATLYHQLLEVRTDPDVEDALRDPLNPNVDRYFGWVSDSGHEIGDLPLQQNVPITNVIREVPLADGGGLVPVQLPHSNVARGPEGPIPNPHPL